MTRRAIREHVFCALFQHDFYPEDEIAHQVDLYIEGIERGLEQPDKGGLQEITAKTNAIIAILPELDAKIGEVSEGWKASRMGKVELTIIRLAQYEIIHDESVPASVAINEAVELAKKFGGDDSSAFINGVLAKLV
jgi:N utilization substance protein B